VVGDDVDAAGDERTVHGGVQLLACSTDRARDGERCALLAFLQTL
jgi:hypothetical protein